MSHNTIVKMTLILIYWRLFQQIYSVNSFNVNILNMSYLTTNSDVRINDDVNNAAEKKIVVGVLLPRSFPHPDDLAYFSRLDSVLPGLILATQELEEILPDRSWDILVGDTDCNSTTGPLQAVDMFYKNRFLIVISS